MPKMRMELRGDEMRWQGNSKRRRQLDKSMNEVMESTWKETEKERNRERVGESKFKVEKKEHIDQIQM